MHLTGRALLLALAAAVAFVAAQWSADPDIDGLWRLPLLLLCVGLGIESWREGRVTVTARLRLPSMLRLGREAEASLELGHDSPRPQRVMLVVALPDALRHQHPQPIVRELPPGATATVPVAMQPVRLGRHAWPVLPARLLGVFGLAWWDRPLDTAAVARVSPDLLPHGAARVEAPTVGARRPPQPDAEREVHRWRRWETGDPLSRIDWKVSARSGVLTTRELRDDQHLDILLCIDAGCDAAAGDGALDALGERVNLAARLAESALARGDRVGLLAFSDRVLTAVPPLGGPAALSRLRAQLAALAADTAPAEPAPAARAAARLLRHPGLVLWFGDPLAGMPEGAALPSGLRGLAVRHAVVVVAPREPAVEALATAPSTAPRRAYTALAAQRRLAADARRASSLEQAGWRVVSGTPARLERSVWEAARRRAPASRRAR